MGRRAPPSLAIALLCAACPAPALENFSASDPETDPPASSTGSTSLGPEPTTSAGPDTTATTDDPGTTSVGSGSTGEPVSTTGGELRPPPAIVEHALEPDPLQQPGPILVTITAEHADGVRMQVDDREPVELTPTQADAFHGEIVFYTALDNGPDHTATFVAWRGALESAPVVIPFAVALPKAGSELFWDGDASLGAGVVAGLAVTPAHELIELGTYYPMGQPRCYLRRRDLGGAWSADDVVELLPGTTCLATDLGVDAAGALHILATRLVNNDLRWWLGRIDTWGEPPTNVGNGAPGEVAHALTLDSARVAVCGSKQKPMELDAAAWIFSPNQPGKVLSFDYPDEKDAEVFSETARDCVFAGNTLVLAGEANGKHGGEVIVRDRHFLLEVDLPTNEGPWHVAGPGPGTQSRARALALDDSGRYLTVGYACDDICQPHPELRMFLPGGAQIWQKTLAPGIEPPPALAWSPAQYLVYLAARNQGQGTAAFFAEAWFPLHGVPTWSYSHVDGPGLHSANAVAIGPYGQIYAGGTTAGGFPALAIIAP